MPTEIIIETNLNLIHHIPVNPRERVCEEQQFPQQDDKVKDLFLLQCSHALEFFKRDPSNPSTFGFPWGDSDKISSHSYYLSREIWTNNSINNIIGSNRHQRWNNQEEVGWSQLIAELKVYESTCSWHESVIQAVGNHLYVQGEEGE